MLRPSELPYTRGDAKAWGKKTIKGMYECPIVPLTSDYELDVAGIHQLAEQYVDWRIPGVVIGGNMSEGWNMTSKQWAQLHQAWAQAIDGRIDLWTILLDPSAAVCLEKISFVRNLGFVGAEIMNPVGYLLSDDEIVSYFEHISNRTDMAIWLYRTPVPKKLMNIETTVRVAALETVIGMKEGSLVPGDLEKLRAVITDPNFVISNPVDRTFLKDLQAGGQVMWAVYYYTVYGKKRELLRRYIEFAEAGEWDKAGEVSAELEPVRDLIDKVMGNRVAKTGSYASSIPLVKAWFEAVGLPAGPALPPVKPLEPAERIALLETLEQVGVI